jgi:hypothetical protein
MASITGAAGAGVGAGEGAGAGAGVSISLASSFSNLFFSMLAIRFSLPFRNANLCASVNTLFGFTMSATGADSIIARRKRVDELRILKDLFLKELPVDDTKTQNIEEYFSRMEKAIYNNEPIDYDHFPSSDDETVHGGRVYKYYPSLGPQELESRHHQSSCGPDVDSRKDQPSILSATESKSSTIEDMEHLPDDQTKCETGECK